MEKVFNLNIDTKDKKIMNVTGIKQFDNNSVLYINITQNSLNFDLTDCTARLNFLKEDGEVLLYMADVQDAKKGKIKIKLSTQVLKNPGIVKVDLSIFDKNIMKITSLDFTMQIEKSIYSNEYYLQRADFDIVQSMHIEEEKRLKNERDRIAAEDKRATAETTREDNEKKRIEAEKKRATAENTRADNELGRITAECGRSTEEKKREAAETTRINQENNRIATENKREAAEKTRQAEYIKNKNLVENFSVCQVYDPKANYKKFNRVIFNGSTYECLKDCTDIDPNNAENWICIAEKGNGNMSTSTYDKNNNGKVDVAEIAESVEWNNVQNRPDVAKIEEQLKENTTKTITQNTNILNIVDNVEGISNISIDGNTIDIVKEPIVSDFKGKTTDNTIINSNVAKYTSGKNTLIKPSEFEYEFKTYSKFSDLNGVCSTVAQEGANPQIPQMLFSFNVISIVENKIGTIPGSNITDKVAWLKKNITKITCNWWGYGSCPGGNKAYLKVYSNGSWSWGTTNTASSPSKIVHNYGNSADFITNDGFAHYLAHTDASDGTTPSTVYTDYINLEVQLNPILKSVGEQENNKIEVKSVGKNLFDISRMNEEKNSNGDSVLDNIINLVENSIETTNNNSAYQGKGFKLKVKPNVKYVISFEVVEGSGYLNINSSDNTNWYGQRIPFSSQQKYSALIYSIKGEFAFSLNVRSGNKVKIKNVQLEEGTAATEYEPYKEDNVIINLKEPLRGLPNNVRDIVSADGTITRRVGKVVLNGSETGYSLHVVYGDLIQFRLEMFKNIRKDSPSSSIVCDKFEFNGIHSLEPLKEGAYVIDKINDSLFKAICYIAINKSKLSTPDVEGFKKLLSENPTTIYYELAEPVIESVGQPLTLQSYTNGILQVDTEVAPYITIKYPSNINSRISTIEKANNNIKNNLSGAWRTLLILADKDLKMKSIAPLSTTDNVSKKINEILGVW